MNTDVLFSSKDMTWETPQDLFDRLNDEFHFTLDVCASPATAKCPNYYTPEVDAFTQEWPGVCWMNPPYGRYIGEWLRKAYEESLKGSLVVCLIPARTDTAYWHDCCMCASEIRFIKGRLKFGKSNNSAPFPSALIIFDSSRSGLAITAYSNKQSTLSALEE